MGYLFILSAGYAGHGQGHLNIKGLALPVLTMLIG
jgi:hypothetical protein